MIPQEWRQQPDRVEDWVLRSMNWVEEMPVKKGKRTRKSSGDCFRYQRLATRRSSFGGYYVNVLTFFTFRTRVASHLDGEPPSSGTHHADHCDQHHVEGRQYHNVCSYLGPPRPSLTDIYYRLNNVVGRKYPSDPLGDLRER